MGWGPKEGAKLTPVSQAGSGASAGGRRMGVDVSRKLMVFYLTDSTSSAKEMDHLATAVLGVRNKVLRRIHILLAFVELTS